MSSINSYIVPTFNTEADEAAFFSGKGTCGLANYGNTCFMNSVIQCLTQTFEFTKEIVSGNIVDNLKRDSEIKNDIEAIQRELVRKWYQLQRAIWNTKSSALGPKSFHQIIQILSMKLGRIEFVGHHQKDAPEFFEFLMENIHMALCEEVDFKITGEPEHEFDKMALVAAKSWEKFFKNEYSIVIEQFYGQYHSIICCPDCGYESVTYQPFLTLQVPVPSTPDKVKIYDCFSLFNKTETLDIENQWKCEKCDDYRNATKKLSVWKTPDILTIHLKRFDKKTGKISTFVDAPLTKLSIKDYGYGYGCDDTLYNLYAVINHYGGTGGGHYTAFVKNYNKKWYCANDDTVTEIDESKVISESSYMLFYRKIE